MIFLGAVHRGYELKEKIKKYLISNNFEVKDCGTDSKEIAHYPIIATEVCKKMDKKKDKAILICGSGIAMSMVANKFKGVRAGICTSVMAAKDGKEHSNLNVLVLPGDYISFDDAIEVVDTWLESEILKRRY